MTLAAARATTTAGERVMTLAGERATTTAGERVTRARPFAAGAAGSSLVAVGTPAVQVQLATRV